MDVLQAKNAAAVSKRAALPEKNHFTIQELLALPPYSGWVKTHPFDAAMLVAGNDDGVALRFFWNGKYEDTTLRLWGALAEKSRLIVDVGAHTGSYSLVAKAANPACEVICLEPYHLNYARLLVNIRANQCAGVHPFMAAAAQQDGVAQFTLNTPAGYLSTGGRLGSGGAQMIKVPTVKIDTLLSDARKPMLDLIKIDVEGAEVQVLQGMSQTLAQAKPVIFFECLSDEVGTALQKLLAPAGYRFFQIHDESGAIEETATLTPFFNPDGTPDMARLNRVATAAHSQDGLISLLKTK